MTFPKTEKQVDVCLAPGGIGNLEANAPDVDVEKLSSGHTSQELANDQVEEEAKPPNGGLEAWLRVLAGHFIYANTWQALRFKRSLS